jgi:DNA-binding NarL/FixJ family response regulator
MLDGNKINLDLDKLVTITQFKINGLEISADFHNGIIYLEILKLDLPEVLPPERLLVAKYVAAGLSDKLIAKRVDRNISTVKYHKKEIAKVYGVELNSTDLPYLLRQ